MEQVTISREQFEELMRDSDRLSWLEIEAKSSRSGITASWMNRDDASPLNPGYRLMRYHKVFNAKATLRDAIDAAIHEENGNGLLTPNV